MIKAYVVGDELKEVEFRLGDLTDAERDYFEGLSDQLL